jgi:hypothetical protein
LLNDGTSPTTGAQILKKETVDLMFQNQIPEFPNFGRQGIPPAKADLTNPIPDLYPGKEQGWGLTFVSCPGLPCRIAIACQWKPDTNIQ